MAGIGLRHTSKPPGKGAAKMEAAARRSPPVVAIKKQRILRYKVWYIRRDLHEERIERWEKTSLEILKRNLCLYIPIPGKLFKSRTTPGVRISVPNWQFELNWSSWIPVSSATYPGSSYKLKLKVLCIQFLVDYETRSLGRSKEFRHWHLLRN